MTLSLLSEGPITEFITTGGIFYNGTCGECALEVAKAAIKGLKSSQLDMIAITHDMQNHGEASSNGASTMAGLADEAGRQGLTILHVTDYQQPLQENWHQEFLDNAGINPIIIEIANGQALQDIQTSAKDESGLQYHYIVILNKQALGYIVNDGDSPEAATTFPVYSYADIASAIPCAIMILKGPIMSNIPSGWTDSGNSDLNVLNGVLTAPNGKTVMHGFRAYILTNAWEASNVPTGGEYGVSGGTKQNFTTNSLFWNGSAVVVEAAVTPPPPPTPSPAPTNAAIVSDLHAILAAVNDALSKVVS